MLEQIGHTYVEFSTLHTCLVLQIIVIIKGHPEVINIGTVQKGLYAMTSSPGISDRQYVIILLSSLSGGMWGRGVGRL